MSNILISIIYFIKNIIKISLGVKKNCKIVFNLSHFGKKVLIVT